MNRIVDVMVIGGGIAGLTAAWNLKRRGKSVIVLDAGETPGGHIRTVSVDGCRLECGPHSFMGSSEGVFRLVDQLRLEPWLEPAGGASGNRYIVRSDRPMPLPSGILSFLTTPLLSPAGKLRLAMEPFIPRGGTPDETAWDFFKRRFGTEAATYMMSPFISGIYAGDIHELGADAAFPKFTRFERESGSMILGAVKYMKRKKARLKQAGIPIRKGLFSFLGGLGRITGALAERLTGSILSGRHVTGIQFQNGRWIARFPNGAASGSSLILAVPPDKAAAILKEEAPDIAPALERIPMAPVAVVHWTTPHDPHLPGGFGMLVPRHCGYRLLGTLFPDELFVGRCPGGRRLFASFYGGRTDPEAVDLPDEVLFEIVKDEHERIFGVDLSDGFEVKSIMRYPSAIPQLRPEHPQIMHQVSTALTRHPGLYLAGNYLTGVGMEHSVNSGFAASDRCFSEMGGVA